MTSLATKLIEIIFSVFVFFTFRWQSEIASIREQYDSDFAIWKREQETIFKLREVESSNAIRQQCRLERDKQIDSIVAKVDAEALKTQQDYEGKIRYIYCISHLIRVCISKSDFPFCSRVKTQYENELRDLERAERISRDKYTETRSKLAECEATIQNLQSTIKQFEMQLNHSQRVSPGNQLF